MSATISKESKYTIPTLPSNLYFSVGARGSKSITVSWMSYFPLTGERKNPDEVKDEELKQDLLMSQEKRVVRRPYRGISIKQETFASLSVVRGGSVKEVKLANSSYAGEPSFTSNFLINSVSENRNEKHQPVSTFGKDYVYFFGEQPRQMTFNCTLLNTENFRWEEEWWYNYEKYFRGTKLAAKSRQARLRFDETIAYGYIINCSSNKDSNNPHVVTVSFTMHVTNIVSTRPTQIGNDKVPKSTEGYGNVDLDTAGESKALKTIAIGRDSAAVRAHNYAVAQKAVSGGGILSRTLGAIADGFSEVLDFGSDAIDFLYGRNLVIPADAAYAQFASGNPQFAEGTDVYDQMIQNVQSNDKSSVVAGRKLSSIFSASGGSTVFAVGGAVTNAVVPQGSYTDNYDEYPFKRAGVSVDYLKKQLEADTTPSSLQSSAERAASVLSKAFKVPKEQLLGSDDNELQTAVLNSASGKSNISSAMRTVGRVAFGALQVAVAWAGQNMREKAAAEDRTLRFPNEIFSIGGAASYYSKSYDASDRMEAAEEKIQNAISGDDF